MMTSALTLLLSTAFSISGETVVELPPTDDIWVYPHASDPERDEFLRVWGLDGASVAATAFESESFCYSYLRFDVSKLPSGKLVGATLQITHVAEPTFTLEKARRNPLEARPVSADFSEKKWAYGDLAKFLPNPAKDAAYGTGILAKLDGEKPFPLHVNLLEGPRSFATALEEARAKGAFALALTSAMSPDGEARSIYKLYSKEGPKEFRPVLRLVFEG
jgi:hypothetical protein